jgi:hypothetical protein
MTVRHEIKSQLAKLLATEDLIVENKKVDTAQFNVHTRVLTLPMWERASNNVYDLLVGHEVGHALYTPDRDWLKEHKISPAIVNVVEDVRIEKMMKRRYAGLSKTFYNGYHELADEDFFAVGEDDVSTYNLADRINLFAKIGNFIDVPFTDYEKGILKMVQDCETFDDVLEVSKVVDEYCREQEKQKEELPNVAPNGQPQPGGNMSGDNQESQEGEFDSEEPEDGESHGGTAEQEKPSNESGGGDLEVKTAKSLEDALKDLVDQQSFESVYLEIPELDLKNIVVPNREIHDRCEREWNEFIESGCTPESIFGYADRMYIDFKRSAQKEVNYLVKEFECRKAADSYARATTARTGVLDCSKLHTYKYNEDLFKKVTTLADGKNHGLVFVLDWSGSMANVMLDTVKQLYNLIWFCRKVNIPFDVYTFTNDYPIMQYDEDGKAILRQGAYKKKAGSLHINEWFSMINILTSKVNAKTLEQQMKNIFRIASSFKMYGGTPVPTGMSLSGTPLNESMIALHQILPSFKKEHKLQKVQCIVLSDGEGAILKYHREVKRRWEDEPFLGTASIGSNCILRNRKTGHTYSISPEWYSFTDLLLEDLKQTFKDINFIGIRVLESRDANSFIRRYTGYWGDQYDKMVGAWKKTKAFSIKTSGYHTYFGLSANALSQNSEFTVSDDATKTQIKTAFVKSLRSKKMNKKVLSEFIELVV